MTISYIWQRIELDTMHEKILVTGAGGQIGTELVEKLRAHYGTAQVLASDIRPIPDDANSLILDVTSAAELEAVCSAQAVTQIYHLAAILSAKGEENPLWAWDINMRSVFNVFEAGRKLGLRRIFYPSSIAVFGLEAAKADTPQYNVLIPESIYGISKAAGENLANYYFKKYGLDIRSVRYPGLIGYKSLPGGGTTDYAVDIYHKAVQGEVFTCFLAPDTRLPMMYMEDALHATLQLMQAPAEKITVRTSYNLSGIDFTPAEITAAIREYYPEFQVAYKPDFRQAIADSWPGSIDDSYARRDWGWEPAYDLQAMSKVMLENLQLQYKTTETQS